MLQTSSGRTWEAILRISSTGTLSARAIASSKVRQPGIRKPTVMTLRRKGSRLQWSGLPGWLFAISGHSSCMISR